MTYLEYIDYLLNELRIKKEFALGLYNTISIIKGPLNQAETIAHLERLNHCHALADQAENILQRILDGSLCPFDPID